MSISLSMDRVRAPVVIRRLPRSLDLVLATLLIAAVAVVQAALFAELAPWFLFTAAVVLVALSLGNRAGLWATALSALAAGYVVSSKDDPFLLSRGEWLATSVFVLTAAGLVGLVASMRATLIRSQDLLKQHEVGLAALVEREAFLASVLSSSTDCIKVLDLDGRLTFLSEGGHKALEVSDFNAIAGCPWPSFFDGSEQDQAKTAVAAARAGHSAGFVGKAATMKGNFRWWHVAVSPIFDADGRPERILSVSRDITALRESEEDRDRYVQVIANCADFIGMARLDGSVFFMNDAACRLVGLDRADMGKVRVGDFFAPDQVDAIATEIFPAVERDGSWSGERLFRHFQTGELIPVLYTVFPVRDAAGALIGYGTVTRDFRDRKRAEEQMKLLNGELSHRLKNVLSVVQSVANQTLRQASDPKAARDALSARLVALAAASDILTANDWTSAGLKELAEQALAPHGIIGEQIHLSGPQVTLGSQLAFALALAMHELATNAAKYGALSVPTGQVQLRWWTEAAADEAPLFHLRWEESGGPAVQAPSRRGFGSLLIERSLQSAFAGQVKSDFREQGLIFDVKGRLSGDSDVPQQAECAAIDTAGPWSSRVETPAYR